MTEPHRNKQRFLKETQAVSPVIGTILMVAIAVMLAAGVYVWVTMFDSDQDAPEQVRLRAITVDSDGSGQSDWIRVTMMAANDAPYGFNRVSPEILAPDGGLHAQLCHNPVLNGGGCASPVEDEDAWDVGQSVYAPCQGAGDHYVTITIRGTTVLDDRIRCDNAPTGS